MLKKTIKFNDLDGNELEEDFYFNLTKAEALELQFSHKGGLEDHARKIIEAKDMAQLISLFKELIIKTVGRRSEDGRRFIKSQEIVDDFVQTEAYSELFMELSTDGDFAAKFMNGIMPKDIQEELKTRGVATDVALPAASDASPATPAVSDAPAWLTEGRTPTPEEVRNATPEQLQMAFQRRLAPNGEVTP